MTYVYPVISRRAGGVSVGINLNPNNACNWRCVYCQVPDLKRGAPPEIELKKLEAELRGFLLELLHGDFMVKRVPPEARRINDIALSGNGEPTSAKEFADVILLIGKLMREFDLIGKIKLVLITNGSLVNRGYVQQGLKHMAGLNGEVWFKLDSATAEGMRRINGSRIGLQRVQENLRVAASLCPTWLQTCVFGMDGQAPSNEEQHAYLEMIKKLVSEEAGVKGVLLYGLARPSMQKEASRLSALPEEWLLSYANKIREAGLEVRESL
ncbi:radical SAM protein [Sulfurirhabdus autotrophica]|nr:radical SAM protein [Sulfurirhabdus autotrophica]